MLSCLNVLMLAYKLQHEEDTKEESGKIVNPEFAINPNDVAAYGLTPDDEDGVFCRSLISEKTYLRSSGSRMNTKASDTVHSDMRQSRQRLLYREKKTTYTTFNIYRI